jgi:hypothetical protein
MIPAITTITMVKSVVRIHLRIWLACLFELLNTSRKPTREAGISTESQCETVNSNTRVNQRSVISRKMTDANRRLQMTSYFSGSVVVQLVGTRRKHDSDSHFVNDRTVIRQLGWPSSIRIGLNVVNRCCSCCKCYDWQPIGWWRISGCLTHTFFGYDWHSPPSVRHASADNICWYRFGSVNALDNSTVMVQLV